MAPRPGRSASPTSLIGGKCTASAEQAQEGEIARGRFLRLLLDVAVDLLERGARMELAEQLLQPLAHPALAQQPVIGALLRGEREQRARRHVLGRRRQIGAALGLGDQAGVEGQHGAIAVALLVAEALAVARLEIDHAHARPVGRALAELVVGPHLQERHRHPFVEKGRQRVLGGDHEVGLGGAAAAVLDHLVLAAHLVEVELHQVVDRPRRRRRRGNPIRARLRRAGSKPKSRNWMPERAISVVGLG